MNKRTEINIQYTISTLAVEKLTPSKDAIQLCRKTAAGQISIDDAISSIKRKYGVKGGNDRV